MVPVRNNNNSGIHPQGERGDNHQGYDIGRGKVKIGKKVAHQYDRDHCYVFFSKNMAEASDAVITCINRME